MTDPWRIICNGCFELVRGFGSKMTVCLGPDLDGEVHRCKVCSVAEGQGHLVHWNAAEHAHRRLCDKLEAERKSA